MFTAEQFPDLTDAELEILNSEFVKGEEVEFDDNLCECGTWFVGERRCDCGNVRPYVTYDRVANGEPFFYVGAG